MPFTWTKPAHLLFADEMTAAGYEVIEYGGRNGYYGPAVTTDCNSSREAHQALQTIIRATTVFVTWDQWGRDDLVIYPES